MDFRKTLAFLVIGIFFVVLVFSSGCTDFTASGQPTTTQTSGGNIYLGGTNGLDINFPPNRPPSEIYGNSSFKLAFKLQNEGEHIISDQEDNIIVFISGINPDTYGFSRTNQSPEMTGNLTGKKKIGDSVVPGGITEIVFNATGYDGTTLPMGGTWDQKVYGRVCYPYRTKAISTEICMKRNIFKESIGESSCVIKGEKPVESWGAPIEVTSIEETPVGKNKVAFKVELANVGGGVPYTISGSETIAKCNDLDTGDENEIKLTNATLGSQSLDGSNFRCSSGCSTSTGGKIKLYSDKATILLEANVPTSAPNTEYEEILEMTFDYKYFEDASKTLKIIGT